MAIVDAVIGAVGNSKYLELHRTGQLPFEGTWIELYILWSSAAVAVLALFICIFLAAIQFMKPAYIDHDVLRSMLWVCVGPNLFSVAAPFAIPAVMALRKLDTDGMPD